MYRTSLVPQAAGQAARQGVYDSLDEALEHWLADCQSLRPGSGDRADLIDLEGAEHLRWVAAAGGPFASGALADAVAEELDEVNPRQLALAVRALLSPASSALRVRHEPHDARPGASPAERVSLT